MPVTLPSSVFRYGCRFFLCLACFGLTACSILHKGGGYLSSRGKGSHRTGSGQGGYYQDDGPLGRAPEGLENTPDAVPRVEPYLRATSRPYTVLGKTYVPITDNRPYRVTGMASWYGRKFHGQKTASGEIYDMFKMTAAHPILPIPSYVRVTHLNNGKQVIVRVNDRGPFLHDRVLDLSYTAALKLGYLQAGSGRVLVERLLPDEIERINRGRGGDEPAVPAVIVAPTPAPVSPPAPVPKPAPVSTPALEPASAPTSAPVVPPVPAFPAVPPDDPVSPHAGAKPVAGAPSYYLQLGAYQQREYAQTAQAAYMLQWAHLLPGMGLVVTDQLYRLLAGPFRTREDADNAAGQLGIEGIKSLVIER